MIDLLICGLALWWFFCFYVDITRGGFAGGSTLPTKPFFRKELFLDRFAVRFNARVRRPCEARYPDIRLGYEQACSSPFLFLFFHSDPKFGAS